jgi:hypothetical protein
MHTCHPIDTAIASQWHLVGAITLVGRNTFVQRSYSRGRSWLRLWWRPEHGWTAQAFKSRAAAVVGDFGNVGDKGWPFTYGGPNVWGA